MKAQRGRVRKEEESRGDTPGSSSSTNPASSKPAVCKPDLATPPTRTSTPEGKRRRVEKETVLKSGEDPKGGMVAIVAGMHEKGE
eukprot:2164674-Heterocapsa_arctica.AAC.1